VSDSGRERNENNLPPCDKMVFFIWDAFLMYETPLIFYSARRGYFLGRGQSGRILAMIISIGYTAGTKT
jgi:hypothetical protein